MLLLSYVLQASPPVNVFTGPVSEYPAAARPPKTHTVVPPTEVGGSPRRVEDGQDSQVRVLSVAISN